MKSSAASSSSWFTPYLEGVLPANEVAAIERHLAVCGACRTYVEQMRQTIGRLATSRTSQLRTRQRDEVLAIFRAWKAEQG